VQIHNYFSDLLLSIKSLLDAHILPQKIIKHYDFNIANETFSLLRRDYKPNRELPAAIISLDEDNYVFGERTNNIINVPVRNYNQILILADLDNKKTLYLQEEQTQISINIIINCETQFQAKEIAFHISRYLPKQKYIQLFDYTSFLEIESDILFDLGFDINNHQISNLFTKYNKNLGKVEYCYSVNYEPLIKLENISINISDNTQKTFNVQCSLSYLTTLPLFVVYDPESSKPRILNINVDFTRINYEFISENSMRSINRNLSDNKYGSSKSITRRNLLICDWNDFNYSELDDFIFVSISFDKSDFIISPDYHFNFINGDDVYKNIKPILVDAHENEVRFQFNQDFFNEHLKTDITNPIILQFIEKVN